MNKEPTSTWEIVLAVLSILLLCVGVLFVCARLGRWYRSLSPAAQKRVAYILEIVLRPLHKSIARDNQRFWQEMEQDRLAGKTYQIGGKTWTW